jgi:hypothetical protein
VIHCPQCSEEFDAARLLDNCTGYVAPQNWTFFECPKCGTDKHVAIEKHKLFLGDIDGAPGPCFFPEQEMAVPDLAIQKFGGTIMLKIGDKSWRLPKRRKKKAR